MRNVFFIAFMLVALVYALRRGGGPERAMVGIAAAILLSDAMLHLMVPPTFDALDIGHLAIDITGAAATFILAMLAYRFWPMIAAALHALPLLAHLSQAANLPMHPVAYATMQVAASWLVPPLLIAATYCHQRRLQRNGSDPSWYSSWLNSTPPAARS